MGHNSITGVDCNFKVIQMLIVRRNSSQRHPRRGETEKKMKNNFKDVETGEEQRAKGKDQPSTALFVQSSSDSIFIVLWGFCGGMWWHRSDFAVENCAHCIACFILLLFVILPCRHSFFDALPNYSFFLVIFVAGPLFLHSLEHTSLYKRILLWKSSFKILSKKLVSLNKRIVDWRNIFRVISYGSM